MEDSFRRLESVKFLITDASKGVETIREAVDQIRDSAEHVRSGMDEQEDVSHSVSRNVTEISGSSSENLAQIEQSGWTIRYERWRDFVDGQPSLPARLTARKGEKLVRLVISSWQPHSAP
jgi:hypothetical protein